MGKYEGVESDSNCGNVTDSNIFDLESDQNAAADSLIGFINHIHREQSRSHDDLVDYVESVQRKTRSYNDLSNMAQHSNHKSIQNSSYNLSYYSQESKHSNADYDYGNLGYVGSSPRKSRSQNDLFDLIEKIVGCSGDNVNESTELSIRTVLSDS
jgi:hypothetical protein